MPRRKAAIEDEDHPLDAEDSVQDEAMLADTGRSRRRSSAGVKYKFDMKLGTDDEGESSDDAKQEVIEWRHPADIEEDDPRIELFIGRRINQNTLNEEFHAKYRGLSFLHTAWLTRQEIENHPVYGRFDKPRLQKYERKLLDDGIDELHDVDELKDIVIEIDHIMSHRVIDASRRKTIPRKARLKEDSAETSSVSLSFLNDHTKEAFVRYEAILGRLTHEPEAEPFMEPVDVTAVDDYLEYVTSPMDFGTIAKRMKKSFYRGQKCHIMFVSDVRLVFRNCKLYNDETSEIWAAADHLETYFERLYHEWIASATAWSKEVKGWAPWSKGCCSCKEEKDADQSILCDACDGEYHIYCLKPPLSEVPSGTWLCERCTKLKRTPYDVKTAQKQAQDSTGDNPKNVVGEKVTEYLVQWKSLPYRDCTWETEEDMRGVPQLSDLINRYKVISAVPSEEEITRTMCQQVCCTKQRIVQPEELTTMQAHCSRSPFCSRPGNHQGRCNKHLQKAKDKMPWNLKLLKRGPGGKMKHVVDGYFRQISSQISAFAALTKGEAPGREALLQCGPHTTAYQYVLDVPGTDPEVALVTAELVEFVTANKPVPSAISDVLRHYEGRETREDDEPCLEYTVKLVKDPNFGLGMSLLKDESTRIGVEVVGFHEFQEGVPSVAKASGIIQVGDLIVAIDGLRIHQMRFHQVIERLKSVAGEVELALRTRRPFSAVAEKYSPCLLDPQGRLCLPQLPFEHQQFGILTTDQSRPPVNQSQEKKVNDLQLWSEDHPNFGAMHRLLADAMAGKLESKGTIKEILAIEELQSGNLKQAVLLETEREDILKSVMQKTSGSDSEEEEGKEEGDGDKSGSSDDEDEVEDDEDQDDDGQESREERLIPKTEKEDKQDSDDEEFQEVDEETTKKNKQKKEESSLFSIGRITPHGVVYVERPRTAFKPYTESPEFKNGNKLFKYQVEGLNWICRGRYLGRNLILADEMGLGKTVQVVSSLNYIHTVDNLRGPFLVVVPLSTIQHWKREFENWTDMNVCLYHESSGLGGKGKNLRAWLRQYEWFFPHQKRSLLKFNVLLTTYETVIADYEEFQWVHWRYLVVDEAHRLKSQNSKALKLFKILHTDFRLLLTGTPLQNNTQELWTLLNFIEPNKFGDKVDFERRFGNLQTQSQVLELQAEIAPHILRRVKEDVEKCLPPKEETIIDVELTILQKRYYRAIFEKNRSFLQKVTKGVTPQLLNIHMELRKCCNHPFLLKGVEEKEMEELGEAPATEERMKKTIECSGKLVLVDKLLPKLRAEGHKVLIFSQFVILLDILADYCAAKGYSCERLDGSVQGNDRQSAIDRFSAPESDSFIFLLSTRAGGVGINLVAADTVIIFDSDWNPQNDVQAQARCHRIGQEKAVKVYRLVTRKTFEAEMFERASRKLGLEHAVLGTVSFSETSKGEKISAKELEILLKQGAYAMLDDNEEDSKKFLELDIEQILEKNAHVRVVEQVKTASALGHKVDRSTFTVNVGDQNISVDDPEFWSKVLPDAINCELLLTRLEDGAPFESAKTRSDFLKQVKTAVENLKEAQADGEVDSRELDQACELLRRISVMKKQFVPKQQEMATKMLEGLRTSMVRSCRTKTRESFVTPKKSKEKKSKEDKKKETAKKKNTRGTKSTGRGKKAAEDSEEEDEEEEPVEEEEASEEEMEEDEDGVQDGDEEESTSDICALCGEGGLLILCDGPCMRSFHVECLSLDEAPEDDTWQCPDCAAQKHMCLICGHAGRDNTKNGVWNCEDESCGRFYHTKCLQQWRTESGKALAVSLEGKGEPSFACPQHNCHRCSGSSSRPLLQCIRCPRAFHAKCLPKGKFFRALNFLIICPEHLKGKRVVIVKGQQVVCEDGVDEEEEEDEEDEEESPQPVKKLSKCPKCKAAKKPARVCRLVLKHKEDRDEASPASIKGKKRKLTDAGGRGGGSRRASTGGKARPLPSKESNDEEGEEDDDEQAPKRCGLCINVRKALAERGYEDMGEEDKVEGPILPFSFAVGSKEQKKEKCWVHQRCAEWSPEVFIDEKKNYRNVEKALKRGRMLICTVCKQRGATIGCFRADCKHSYHLRCALSTKGRVQPTGNEGESVFYCEDHVQPEVGDDEDGLSSDRCVCGKSYEDDTSLMMVGCDLCERWYHPPCVGLSEEAAEALTSWVCGSCSKNDDSRCRKCAAEDEAGSFFIGCEVCSGWFHPACVGLTEEEARKQDVWTCTDCFKKNGTVRTTRRKSARSTPTKRKAPAERGANKKQKEGDGPRELPRRSSLRIVSASPSKPVLNVTPKVEEEPVPLEKNTEIGVRSSSRRREEQPSKVVELKEERKPQARRSLRPSAQEEPTQETEEPREREKRERGSRRSLRERRSLSQPTQEVKVNTQHQSSSEGISHENEGSALNRKEEELLEDLEEKERQLYALLPSSAATQGTKRRRQSDAQVKQEEEEAIVKRKRVPIVLRLNAGEDLSADP